MKLQSFIQLYMPSRTTPTEIYRDRSLPPTASIYRMEASRFWQFRYFIDGEYVRKSTRETEKARALEKAKEFFRDTLLKQSLNVAIHPTTFSAVSKRFLDRQKTKVEAGRISERTHRGDVYLLQSDILPFFQTKEVSSISKSTVEDYLASLAKRHLSKSTLNKHINVIRKILNFALDDSIIKSAPRLPSIGVDNNARAYFDLESYQKLSKTARDYANRNHVADCMIKGRVVRKLKYTLDFASLIDFSVNVFIRISDIKDLRHKHVRVNRKARKNDLPI